ncbi:MAG: L-seryl-tRNA(Sec) selenium transferase [Acidobacteria bacterium]|nr:L-seryl-tRNA(Sec) selenium transferase [Acidobacteriota bacterium]
MSGTTNNRLRNLPSIDHLLHRAGLQKLIATAGRETVRGSLRRVIAELRREITGPNGEIALPVEQNELAGEIEKRLHAHFARRHQSQMQRVINATGVVLHTNLGRAPLSRAALQAISLVGGEYCNLEYDLGTGTRGRRGAAVEAMFSEVTGCQAAAVVNNCAAAVLITLNTLAEGGEVIVSRGELIEIGGSFRIPDVIAKSGARIREVGTTNRTRLSDYEKAINENTRVILRAHPSNYRIIGFTDKPSLEDLVGLARSRNLPLFEDLGSGSLIDLKPMGIAGEPTVGEMLGAGCSVVSFSGDKLLGGPQVGIILGERGLIERIKSNPLMRALRVDKLTFVALEATLRSYALGRAITEIPTLAALKATKDEIRRRSQAFIRRAKKSAGGLQLNMSAGFSVAGGGSAPDANLPTTLISVASKHLSASEMEARLRQNTPPVITRIENDQLLIDLRTVSTQGEKDLIAALAKL